MSGQTHPLAQAAKTLARKTNRRAIRWGAAGILVLLGIVTIAAYSVQSTWVSETTANADTVAFYQNQTLKSDVKLLSSDEAKALIAETEQSYGSEWNKFIDAVSSTQDEKAKTDQQAANKVADGLIFPNLRADYKAWAQERAQSQVAVTAKQQAQLKVLRVYKQVCLDKWAGHASSWTLATYRDEFDDADAGILAVRATELGLHQCGG